MKFIKFLICLLLITFSSIRSDASEGRTDKTIIVFAAASTSNALEKIKDAYEAKHPSVKIRVSYGASALLARQISKGAPADLFLSANKDWVDWLGKTRINISEPVIVARNNLVLISPRNSDMENCPTDDLEFNTVLGEQRFVIADPGLSPLGQYSKEALIKKGIWETVKKRLAIAGNANLVVKMIERGAAPYGIAYQSSTFGNDAIKALCLITTDFSNPINYYLVDLKASKQTNRFIDFIRHEGGKYFIKAGFIGIAPK